MARKIGRPTALSREEAGKAYAERAKKLRAERILRGLCCRCGYPAAEETKLCAYHLNKDRARKGSALADLSAISVDTRTRALSKYCGKGHEFTKSNTETTKSGRRCKECLRIARTQLRKTGGDSSSVSANNWRTNNSDRIRQQQALRWGKIKLDPSEMIRRRAARAMNGAIRKHGSWEHPKFKDILGCTAEEFKKHIERQFKDGMNWERISEIHLDHIRPVASFDLSDPSRQRECFHYSNIQPLWALDNQRKNSLWEGIMHRRAKAPISLS